MSRNVTVGNASSPSSRTDGDASGAKGPAVDGRVRKVRRRRARRDGTSPASAEGDAPGPPRPVMEPLVVTSEGGATTGAPAVTDPEAQARAARSPIVEVDVEREVIGTRLYRERRIIEQLVDEEVPTPTREERRRARRQHARARARARPRAAGGLRGTLGYKAFYDLVCNRVGLVLAGFGTVMLLFVMLYDPVRRVPLEFGPRHMLAVAVSGVVYGVGMVFEMLRAWSWECEGADESELGGGPGSAAPSSGPPSGQDLGAPIPLVPEEAMAQLGHRNGDQYGTGGGIGGDGNVGNVGGVSDVGDVGGVGGVRRRGRIRRRGRDKG